MHLRKTLLQTGAQIEEILERQVRMQSADDVEFCDRLGESGCRGFESFFERHSVGAGRVFLATESAEPARRYTNVGGVNVAVNVEISLVAVEAFAHVVGHPAYGENVARTVKGEGIVSVKPLAGHNFGLNRLEAPVVGLERMGWARRRHLFDDIAEGKGNQSARGGSGAF